MIARLRTPGRWLRTLVPAAVGWTLACASAFAATTTTTTLASSANPAYVGQGTTLTATVSGGSPTGTVTFKDGTTTLGTGTISSGKATYAATFATTGTHSLTAAYAGTSSYKASTSTALSETVNARHTTTTALASAANPAYAGQSVTLTATIAGGSSPTGSVTFKDGTTTLGTGTVSGTTATYAATFTTTGAHSLTAVYAGDAGNTTSTSSALSETIDAKAASTTALASGTNPVNLGVATTLTATVTGNSPTGTVTFKDGTTTLGTGTISGTTATYAATFTTAGAHTLTAVYAGDTVNNASTSSALTQTVNPKAATTTTLASGLNPAYVSQGVTLTATVTGASPTGTVTFKDGTATLGTGTIAGGSATYAATFTTTGAHSLTAVYGGDGANATSTSSALAETVNAKKTTTTALASGTNPAYVNQSVTLTATLAGATSPTGTVTFKDGTATLGTGTVSGTTATYAATFTTTGSHSLTAVYGGDAVNNASTSSALTQTVSAQVTSTTTLTSSVDPSTTGQATTLTAKVTGTSPTGTITFKDGTTTLGTGTLAGGQATYSATFAATGTHSLTAAYSGDAVNKASTSGTLSQTVSGPPATTSTLTSSVNPVNAGQSTTLKATVSVASGALGGGTLSILDGATVLTSFAVPAGYSSYSGSYTTPFTAAGAHSLTATYAGDPIDAGSTSTAVIETVKGAPTTTSTLTSSANPINAGQSTTLKATVAASSGALGGGTLSILDGTTVLTSFAVPSGYSSYSGSYTTPFTAAGAHSLTATYAGDPTDAGSTSTPVVETVNALVPVLSSNANPAFIGQSTKFSAQVTGSNLTGTVTYYDGSTALGSVPMPAGGFTGTVTTSFTITLQTTGTHSITAVYGGDPQNLLGTSAVLAQVINPPAVTLTSTANPAYPWQPLTLTATATGGKPSGMVTFMDGATTIGAVYLDGGGSSSGSATLQTDFPAIGTHALSASYAVSDGTSAQATLAETVRTGTGISTTTLASSINPVYSGRAIVLTATVAGAAPNGNITFMDGATQLGTATLSGGVATLNTSFTGFASHSLTAVYAGDGTNAPSTSAAVVETVTEPTATLASSPNPSYPGQGLTLTITVNAAAAGGTSPAGQVTFMDGSTTLGTAALDAGGASSGTASYTLSFPVTGAHHLTASYAGNDGSTAQATLTHNVQTGSGVSSATLTSSAATTYVGKPVTLTAVVSGASPVGTVDFSDGATPLGTATLSNGSASISAAFTATGTHHLSVAYLGDSVNAPSSGSFAQGVNPPGTTSALLTSSANPSYPGQAMTVTMVVAGTNPTGTVTIYDGGTAVSSGYLSQGTGSTYSYAFQPGYTAVGTHTLTGQYAGDTSNSPAATPALVQTVKTGSGATTTTLGANFVPAYLWHTVTLTAQVSGASPAGVVIFSDGGTVLGTAAVGASGAATLQWYAQTAGVHNLQAAYAGDNANAASTGTMALTVLASATSTTVVASSLNPSAPNATTTLTATVTGGNPTGTLTFYDGTTLMGYAPLSASTATTSTGTYSATYTAVGTHSITAQYGGDSANSASTSAVLVQTVKTGNAATTTALASATNPSYVGRSVALTATVSGSNVSGLVTFLDGATVLGTAPVYNGTANLAPALATAGTHSLTAVYSGDAANAASTSATLAQVVNAQTSSTTTLASSANPAGPNQDVTFTVTVVGGSPSGPVNILIDGAPTTNVYLSPTNATTSTATYQTSFAAAATHTVTAVYAGDTANTGSTSAPLAQTVKTGSTATATTLVPSTASALLGRNVTLTATVAGSAPTGSVTFMDGATAIGTQQVGNGTAALVTTFSAAGAHSLTAVFSGDVANAPSTSPAAAVTVAAQVASTTAIASAANPAPAGYVAATITVTGASPTGIVTVMDGQNPQGQFGLQSTSPTTSTASASLLLLSLGNRNLTAVYAGDGANLASTSPVLVQTITPGPSTTTLTTSQGEIAVGASATLVANVTLAQGWSGPGDYVTFMDGTTRLGTVALNGSQAALTTLFRTAGVHSLTASFGGDAYNLASVSSAVAETVDASANGVILFSGAGTSHVGQSVALTASVTPASATGTISFLDGATVLGTAPLAGGSAAFSATFSTAGAHSLSASYGGDGANPAATSAVVTQTVDAQSPTVTTLVANLGTVPIGAGATFTASVVSADNANTIPTGSVTFMDGATSLGTTPLHGNQATLGTTFSTGGIHTMSAVYNGDPANQGSTSAPVYQAVGSKGASSTSLSSSQATTAVGQTTMLTASIAGASPTGQVTFLDGSATLGTGTISGGTATFLASFATAGSHALTATYAGDGVNAPSTSAALTQTVTAGGAALPMPPVSPVPVVNYEFDANGNPTKTTLAQGVPGYGFATQAAYDTLDRAYLVTDAKSGQTKFGFDGLDRLVQVTDPRQISTNTPRDGLGDVKSLASPDTGVASNTYDNDGNLKTVTDSRGVLATFGYDALNRETSAVYSQSGHPSSTYTLNYDETGTGFSNGIGRLTSTAFPAGSTRYAYDPLGELIASTWVVNPAAGANAAAVTLQVGYGYDDAGHLTSITYPSGRQVTFTYENGQATAIGLAPAASGSPVSLLSEIQYVPFGGVLGWQWQFATGTQQTSRMYDTSGRLVRYQLGNYARDLTFDPAGRLTNYTHYDLSTGTATAAATALDQTFGYDELGRLTSVSAGGSSWGIGYDANGNRTSVTLNGTQSVYTTSPTSNQLASITNPARSFGYDAAGNTTSDSTGYNVATYNLANRLETLTKGGQTETFAHDAEGLRIRKFSSSGAASTVLFAYDPQGHLLGEYDQNGAPLREYVWLGAMPVAMFTPDPANGGNPPLAYFIHTDHLGAPRVVVDSNNAIRWRWLAEPFGTTAPETNPSNLGTFTMPLRLPGQYADAETGLNYNTARDYDATTGRYVESDPIGLRGGSNTYGYVGGNSVSRTDPEGKFIPIVVGIVELGIEGYEAFEAFEAAEAAEAAIQAAQASARAAAAAAEAEAAAAAQAEAAAAAARAAAAAAAAAATQTGSTPTTDQKCPKKGDCRKASDYELKNAGIDPHSYKTENGAVPWSRYDICSCKDGTFRIAQVGQCGKTTDFWY